MDVSEKLPQPTTVIIERLRRVAKRLRQNANGDPVLAADANTCDQAAGRLDDLSRGTDGLTPAQAAGFTPRF